jgi:hypothetical protein
MLKLRLTMMAILVDQSTPKWKYLQLGSIIQTIFGFKWLSSYKDLWNITKSIAFMALDIHVRSSVGTKVTVTNTWITTL